MKIVAIIQARMTSSRLPGKVLRIIGNQPMLWYSTHRLSKSSMIDHVVVATSNNSSDDDVFRFCKSKNFNCFRGDLDNVLSRYYFAGLTYQADIMVRITADCPLSDPLLVEHGIELFQKNATDYLSNTVKRTYPRGFDFEIMTFDALKKAYLCATKGFEKEHVTPYIWKTHPEQFRISQITQPNDYSSFRITVDTQEDFEVMKILIEQYKADQLNYNQITTILQKHPEIAALNKNVQQKHV